MPGTRESRSLTRPARRTPSRRPKERSSAAPAHSCRSATCGVRNFGRRVWRGARTFGRPARPTQCRPPYHRVGTPGEMMRIGLSKRSFSRERSTLTSPRENSGRLRADRSGGLSCRTKSSGSGATDAPADYQQAIDCRSHPGQNHPPQLAPGSLTCENVSKACAGCGPAPRDTVACVRPGPPRGSVMSITNSIGSSAAVAGWPKRATR